MQRRVSENKYRTTMVCIDSYDGNVLNGRLYNPYIPKGWGFGSLMQFLLGMEDLLDGMNFPQSFNAIRSFSDTARDPEARPPMVETPRDGRLATFAVRVLFRQNASWQGSLTWLEEDREESFRSVLELLLLMHSALESKT